MPRRRSVDTIERDHRACDLFRRGLSYRQIGAELGISHQSAFDAVRRAARENAGDPLAAAEALQIMLSRLQDYRRLAWRVASTKHYMVSAGSGKIALHPDTGQPLLDDTPVLHALDRLIRADQEEAKLLGLYAPAKARIEVITEDVVDAELAQLAQEIADSDAAGHPGPA